MNKTLTDNNLEQIILKGKTNKMSGFTGMDGTKKEGKLLFDKEFRIVLE